MFSFSIISGFSNWLAVELVISLVCLVAGIYFLCRAVPTARHPGGGPWRNESDRWLNWFFALGCVLLGLLLPTFHFGLEVVSAAWAKLKHTHAWAGWLSQLSIYALVVTFFACLISAFYISQIGVEEPPPDHRISRRRHGRHLASVKTDDD